jgi:hypothetical protein
VRWEFGKYKVIVSSSVLALAGRNPLAEYEMQPVMYRMELNASQRNGVVKLVEVKTTGATSAFEAEIETSGFEQGTRL